MSHMVIFRTPEGKPGYQPAETVHDAVAVVERLRNDEGVENVRIFRLEELTFEYRPYYKVELAGVGSDAETSAPAAVLDDPAPATDDDHTSSPGDGAIDVGHEEVEANSQTETSPGDEGAPADDLVEPVQASEQPPWAAPPPPPPGPSTDSVFGGESGSDEEFSSSAQRRGLFGR